MLVEKHWEEIGKCSRRSKRPGWEREQVECISPTQNQTKKEGGREKEERDAPFKWGKGYKAQRQKMGADKGGGGDAGKKSAILLHSSQEQFIVESLQNEEMLKNYLIGTERGGGGGWWAMRPRITTDGCERERA